MRVLRHEESIKIGKKKNIYKAHENLESRNFGFHLFQKEDMLQKVSDLDNLEARNIWLIEDGVHRETLKARCGISRRNLLEAQVEG